MSRRRPWRRLCPDVVDQRINQAMQATIYIVHQTGPTGFVIKEDASDRKYKVSLGEEHSCTCRTFEKEKELCIHILWLLIRKFRIPKENPIAFQLSLVEREINEILRGTHVYTNTSSSNKDKKLVNDTDDKRKTIQQREITKEDVCPICQEELLDTSEPVTYCKYGCGNNTHIKCIKIWAEHQKTVGEATIKCPLCREDFGSLQAIKEEMRQSSKLKTRAQRGNFHLGVTCNNCRQCPIAGNCYRCAICYDYNLCHACYAQQIHSQHSFNYREKSSQRWKQAPRITGQTLPDAVIADLVNREIENEDYELLLQLDSAIDQNQVDTLPEEVIRRFPIEIINSDNSLLNQDIKCRICMLPFQIRQYVRKLPCRHKFHVQCIDHWLMHERSSCPIDGEIINPVLDGATSIGRCNRNNRRKVGHHHNRGQRHHRQDPIEAPSLAVTAVQINQSGTDSNQLQRHRAENLSHEHAFHQRSVVHRHRNRDHSVRPDTDLDFTLSGAGLQISDTGPHRDNDLIQVRHDKKMSRPPLYPKHKEKYGSSKPLQRAGNMAVVAQGVATSIEHNQNTLSSNNSRSFSAEDRQKNNRKSSLTRKLRKTTSLTSLTAPALPSVHGNRVSRSDEGSKAIINTTTSGELTRSNNRVHKGLAIATVMKVNQTSMTASNNANQDNGAAGQKRLILPPI
ncbi:E3 ubiquitin-protein ligase Zswim2 [Trichoplax sp. H2]|nr:E3 ubiquitin-protein ligase Zswim2 [Trichoplax sp. H2]|eukprot:RDD38628.1 E3 ubiquitin-protein ligase Zswim2 [Trichoplax sp. H2]